MGCRRFAHTLLLLLALFLAGNAVIWYGWTGPLLGDTSQTGGDLARLAYAPELRQPRANVDDLPRRHLEFKDYRGGRVDLLTVGDSFSNGPVGGRNRYWQDYVASRHGLAVLNLPPVKDLDQISTVAAMANSGQLQELGVRYVLVQAAEKAAVGNFAKPLDFSVQRRFGSAAGQSYGAPPPLAFVNDGNLKFLAYRLLYRFSPNGVFGQVYRLPLQRRCFDHPHGDTLLVDRNDLRHANRATPANIARLNDNLNRLAELLAARGIRLYFLPAVDKYNLYREELRTPPPVQSRFFEELRPLAKRYTLVDSKELLQLALRQGVPDLYYIDDTHWGWRGAEILATALDFH